VYRREKRIAVFDMDSTLIQQEVIDELAKKAGVHEEVKKITEEAMRGELDFEQSLRKRVSKLQGCPVTILDEVREIIRFTEGAKDLCRCLKKLGFKLAVVSGGFVPLAQYVKEELSLDFAFANTVSPRSLPPCDHCVISSFFLSIVGNNPQWKASHGKGYWGGGGWKKEG